MSTQLPKPFALWDRIGSISSGTAANTYGTAVQNVVPSWAKGILAVAKMGDTITPTAAQGASHSLRINIASLGISNAEFLVNPYNTSAPATNESGWANQVDIIPLDIRCQGGETISVDTAPLGAQTVATQDEVVFLYSNAPDRLPDRFLRCLENGRHMPARGGKVESAQALPTTVTALTSIKVPSWVEAVIGCKLSLTKTGAITASENDVGYVDLVNTMGYSPFKVCPSFGHSGTIGTPVGTSPHGLCVPYLPFYIPGSGKEETWTPNVYLRTAVTTDNRASFGLIWR